MIECKICKRLFEGRTSICNHLVRKHKLTGKEYYDKYLKQPEEKCNYKDCDNATIFLTIEEGYKECCCLEHTNLYRYGVKSNLNFEEVKAKAQKNSHTKEAIQKQTETNLKRYGGVAPMCSDAVKKKATKTCMDKFGVDNVWKAPEIREKCKQTKLDRFIL